MFKREAILMLLPLVLIPIGMLLGAGQMSIGLILFLAVIVAGITYFVVLFVRGAGPKWTWALGSYDPVRNAFFRSDGSWRRYGRLSMFIAILALATIGILGI